MKSILWPEHDVDKQLREFDPLIAAAAVAAITVPIAILIGIAFWLSGGASMKGAGL